jgi:hypothetical protein
MELAVHESLGGAYVEFLGVESIRLHIPLGMSSEELSEKVGTSLTEDQLKTAINLLANDKYPRVFESKGDFVLIKPVEG